MLHVVSRTEDEVTQCTKRKVRTRSVLEDRDSIRIDISKYKCEHNKSSCRGILRTGYVIIRQEVARFERRSATECYAAT